MLQNDGNNFIGKIQQMAHFFVTTKANGTNVQSLYAAIVVQHEIKDSISNNQFHLKYKTLARFQKR